MIGKLERRIEMHVHLPFLLIVFSPISVTVGSVLLCVYIIVSSYAYAVVLCVFISQKPNQ